MLDLGPVEPLPALNSFFARPDDRAPNLEALRRFLADLPEEVRRCPGHPQVTISAITGSAAVSGAAVVLAADSTDRPPVVGAIAAP